MNRESHRIFESYAKRSNVLTEAPIYASEGDIDVSKVKSHSKQGYAIGDHARKTSADVDQLTQAIVDQIKTSVFLKKQSVVRGKKYDLFFPGTMDQFRDRLTSIVGQTLKPQVTRPSDWKYSARIIANDVIRAVYADGEDVASGTVANSSSIDSLDVKTDIAKSVTNAVAGATPEEKPTAEEPAIPTTPSSAEEAPMSNDQTVPSPETITQAPIDSPAIAKKVERINRLPFNITKQYEVASEVALNDEELRIPYHRLVKRIGTDRPVYGRDLANCLMGTMSYPMAKETLIKLVAANAIIEPDSEETTNAVETPTIPPEAEENPKDAQDEEIQNMIRSQAGGKTVTGSMFDESARKVVAEATPYNIGTRAVDYFKTKLPTLAPNTAATAAGRSVAGQDANTKYREMLKSLATAGIREDQITPQILKNYAQNTLGVAVADLPSLRHLAGNTPIRNPAQAFLEIIQQGNRAKVLPGYTAPTPRARKGSPSVEEYSQQLAKTLSDSGVTIDPKVLGDAIMKTVK